MFIMLPEFDVVCYQRLNILSTHIYTFEKRYSLRNADKYAILVLQ